MIENDYEVVVADTRETRRIHHRIRYQVYCLETGYEDPHAYPDGLERDEWDEHAIHFLVRHRPSQQWVGTMRLVKPMTGALPLHAFMGQVSEGLCGESAWEISRVCIPATYRKMTAVKIFSMNDTMPSTAHIGMGLGQGIKLRAPYFWSAGTDGGDCLDVRAWRSNVIHEPSPFKVDSHFGLKEEKTPLRVNSTIVITKLFRAAICCAETHEVSSLYFLIRPSLARIIERLNFRISRVGVGCEHHGLRYPYKAVLSDVGMGVG